MHDVSFGAGGNMLNNAHTCSRHHLTISIPPGHPLPSRHPTSTIFPAPRRVQTTRPTFTHTLQGSLRRINTYTSLIHPCLCRLQSNNFFLTLMGLKDFCAEGPLCLPCTPGWDISIWMKVCGLQFCLKISSSDKHVSVQVSRQMLYIPALIYSI